MLAGLYYFLNKDFKRFSFQNYQPVTTEPISFNLEISNPEDEILVFEDSLVISGTTSPLSTILISVNDEDFGLEASSKSQFSTVVSLQNGLNRLQVTAIDQEGNTKTDQRTVYYSEEKI